MKHTHCTQIFFVCATALSLTACGGGEEPKVPPQPAPTPEQVPAAGVQPGQYPAAQPGTYPAGAPAQPGAAPAGAPGAQPAPAAQPGIATALPPTTQAGPQAQAIDSSLAAAAQPILNQLAATEAPGAKAVGAPLVGNFGQGQMLEAALTLQPGKCYTVVGAGLPNVTELDIQLAPPIQGAPILATDKSTGPQAVLGGKATGCYRYAFPFAAPAKVIVLATGGAGIAAAQVYEK